MNSLARTSAIELIRQLNETDEHNQIEAKLSKTSLGDAALETVCAFANEPGLGGGYLLLGVSRVDGLFPQYDATGVDDPEKIQSELTTRCAADFNVPIRPQIFVEIIRKRPVVVAFIPEACAHDKPVFFKSQSLPRGALRRIGPSDLKCTDEDLATLYQSRHIESLDEQIVSDSTMSDIDPAAIAQYRKLRATAKSDAAELQLNDRDLLLSLRCVKMNRGKAMPTVAGVLLFGTAAALRRCFPMMRVDYIRTSGVEWLKEAGGRMSTVEIVGPLVSTIFRANAAILDDIPKAFDLPHGELQRTDMPIIPDRVIREAVVNAVMHRSYRDHSPVQIIRYANRIELRNPGYSLKSDELFGQPGSEPRNPTIAAVLHDLQLAETKGIGVSVMQKMMQDSGLTPPYLESDRDGNQFLAIFLFHHFLSPSDVEWLAQFRNLSLSDNECRALVFAREMRAINNAAYRGMTGEDTLAASKDLRRLREHGLLEMKGKGSATFYIPSKRLLTIPQHNRLEQKALGKREESKKPDCEESDEDRIEVLPNYLQRMVDKLPAKASAEVMSKVILSLCHWRDLKAWQVADYCNRKVDPLRNNHLANLLEKELLSITAPPNSPNVRYKTSALGEKWLNAKKSKPKKKEASDEEDVDELFLDDENDGIGA